jgi:hypothetical protein
MAGFRSGRYEDKTPSNKYSTGIAPNTSGKSRATSYGALKGGAGGNMQQASFQSQFGNNPATTAPAGQDPTQKPVINDVFADTPTLPQGKGGFGSSLATGLGTKVAGKALDKAWDGMSSAFRGAPSIPQANIDLANVSSDPIESLNHMQGWTDSPNLTQTFGGADVSQTADVAADVMAEGGGELINGADGGFFTLGDAGSYLPYAGSVIKLVQGDVKGAAGSAAGTFIGSMLGGPVGGFIGGFIGGGGCFITEATMAGMGMQDPNQLEQSEPLQVLRWFRDNVMMRTPQGQQMVQQYYLMAPDVVEAVNQRPDAAQIYGQIFQQFIAPAVEAVKSNDFQQALQIYAEMIQFVAPLGAEMDGDPMQESEFEDLADSASIVNSDPDLAQAAIGSPVLGQVMAR